MSSSAQHEEISLEQRAIMEEKLAQVAASRSERDTTNMEEEVTGDNAVLKEDRAKTMPITSSDSDFDENDEDEDENEDGEVEALQASLTLEVVDTDQKGNASVRVRI